MKRSVLTGLSILALVAGSALSAEPGHKYDGVYTGTRSLKGTASTECPAEEDVSVTIHGEWLTFTNRALKNFTLPFEPDQAGSFGQILTGPDGIVVNYHGQMTGDILAADVMNPPCDYHWDLKKQ
jgi:hypothetical protein